MAVIDPDAISHLAWQPTRWSMIQRLADKQDQAAWTQLFHDYEPPMRKYARRWLSRLAGGDPADADDVVQDYFQACLEKDWLTRARQDAGRFRAFVQMTLKRHVLRWVRDRHAQRRHPKDAKVLTMDDDESPIAVAAAAELDDEFDKSWTEIAVDRALRQLGDADSRASLVVRDLIRTEGDGSADIHDQLGINRAYYNVLKGRVRTTFSRYVAQEMQATVADESALRSEWEHLKKFLP